MKVGRLNGLFDSDQSAMQLSFTMSAFTVFKVVTSRIISILHLLISTFNLQGAPNSD